MYGLKYVEGWVKGNLRKTLESLEDWEVIYRALNTEDLVVEVRFNLRLKKRTYLA